MIKIQNMNKQFKLNKDSKLSILENMDLSVDDGDFISIMGSSGVGKTTLLNIIGLLDSDYDGTYVLNGTDVSKLKDKNLAKIRNQQIGYVFQDYKLINEFTAYENIEISLLINKDIKSKDIKPRIVQALKDVGLDESLTYKKIAKLSGGEKQRVAIARAIAKNPKLIIADEPTGAIDINTKDSIMKLLKELNENGKTIVLVTHDPDVSAYANKRYDFVDRSLSLSL